MRGPHIKLVRLQHMPAQRYKKLKILALPGSAWVQIESAAVKVDRRLEVLGIAEAAGQALDLLNLAVKPLAHRVGDWMLIVGQDVVDVSADGPGCLANRRQPTVRRPDVPPFPELPAGRGRDVVPQTA